LWSFIASSCSSLAKIKDERPTANDGFSGPYFEPDQPLLALDLKFWTTSGSQD
jgi:hypothetical protein